MQRLHIEGVEARSTETETLARQAEHEFTRALLPGCFETRMLLAHLRGAFLKGPQDPVCAFGKIGLRLVLETPIGISDCGVVLM